MNDSLNMRIAYKLGYRLESVPYGGESVERSDNDRHFLVTPDGRRLQYSSFAAAIKSLPDWEHSTDAALGLLSVSSKTIDIFYEDGWWHVVADSKYPSQPFDDHNRVYSELKLVEAVCRAFLEIH